MIKENKLFRTNEVCTERQKKRFEKMLSKSTQENIFEYVVKKAFPSPPIFMALSHITDDDLLFWVASVQQTKSICAKAPVIQVGITGNTGVEVCVQAIMQIRKQETFLRLFEHYADNSPLYSIYDAGSTYYGGYEKIDALVNKLDPESRRKILDEHRDWNRGDMRHAFEGGVFDVSNGMTKRQVKVTALSESNE
ncbi:MAG TPA: hypothetical protein PLC13_04140 [Bacillota bacterium]|nr:hypothetical protein [Bacillota bacterium]